MNLFHLFSRPRSASASASRMQPHMTWGSSSVGRSVTRTTLFLKRQLWIWPIIAIVVLSLLGYFVNGAIESTIESNLRSELETILGMEVEMIEKWLDTQERTAQMVASDARFRDATLALMTADEEGSEAADGKSLAELRKPVNKAIGPFMTANAFVGFHVFNRAKQIVASSQEVMVGQRDVKKYDALVSRALNGDSVVSAPFGSVALMRDGFGEMRTGVPTMWVCVPLRDSTFQVVGVLSLQMRPETEFTELLQAGRLGQSGETYAFDKSGTLVSNSRFDSQLMMLGILPDHEHSRSILNISIRDPGGDMEKGYRPSVRRSEMPLTRPVSEAVLGSAGVDLVGYRDYRGVLKVGAWHWLPSREMGIVTEIDHEEAFAPLTILRRTFWSIYGLLVVSSLAIFVFTLVVARLQRDARKAAIDAQQLGQYTLEEKLGAGAMGVVYRGHHSMLRRPTAIKLLDADKVDAVSIERFEREVQITCRLNHPSTIAIYDFGRTPEGVFYYAMEYLDGVNLQSLVEKYGAQPGGRVVSILMQVCGSLYEAHSQGLVHRDIKPANIMLNRRGGAPDVVKVLDFGLVKAVDEKHGPGGAAEGLTGTPLYMSPEAIQTPLSVDGRSDLYSVGALGYFLLTGKPVFDAGGLAELCMKHVDETPQSPSQRLGRPFSAELEHAILACLEKTRAKRPQTARDLAEMLRKCPEAASWSLDQAEAWWSRHERGQAEHAQGATSASTYDQTMAHKP